MVVVPYRMTRFETACGWVPGHVPAPGEVRRLRAETRPLREALDDVLRRALRRPPCFVAFSGGRDSAVLLAAAFALARREGFAEPVPVTRLYPTVRDVDESRWQSEVLEHLGAGEWARLSFDDELDLLGPVAQRVLERHGPVWPSTAHVMVPLLEAARDGVLLTGEGGDEIFQPPRAAGLRPLRDGRRGVGAWRVAAVAVAPRALRRREARARLADALPEWLTLAARRELLARLVEDDVHAGFHLRARLERLLTRRGWRAGRRTIDALAAEVGVRVEHPFLHPSVLGAAWRTFRPWGPRSRTEALRALFPDLLPGPVLARQDKAVFNRTLFRRHTREFVADWGGEGLDPTLVQVDALRAEWNRSTPSILSAPLLQSVWYANRQL